MNLTELANKFGSDKGTVHGGIPHKYTFLYDLILQPLREQNINFLEIGLAVGGPELGGAIDRVVQSPSVQMWLEYFGEASIFGFDISDFSHMKAPRFHFIRGDCGSNADLARLAAAADHFDIIIDDASHASYHQQLAFKNLWAKLARNGLYIIEDLHWQSPVFEDVLPVLTKTAAMLIAFFERGEYIENELLSIEFLTRVKSEAYSFGSFPAIDGRGEAMKQIVLRKA